MFLVLFCCICLWYNSLTACIFDQLLSFFYTLHVFNTVYVHAAPLCLHYVISLFVCVHITFKNSRKYRNICSIEIIKIWFRKM